MTQLIDQPTNLESRGISCVNLIITDQPNLFIDYGIHSSLDNCCHHQIIHGKVNISIPSPPPLSIPSPPPFKRRIWDYAKANKDEIQECLINIDWHYKLSNLSATNMVSEYTSTIKGVMSRFIPNKIITCNDKDPPWITPEIKTAIKRKHRVYNKFVRRGRRPDEWDNVRLIRNGSSKMVTIAKDNYFASLGRKLSNPAIGIKTYWSTLNKIVNKKKATNIPPLLENGLFVTNFQNKAEIFNNYFVQQCSLNMNDSVLPRSYITRCNNLLETIEIDADKVLRIIRSLDCNKAHGWDDMSVSMVKICDSSIVRPLCLIYETSMHTSLFPDNWKKANVLLIHKNKSRQLEKNYRPISLLPVCGKIFEKVFLTPCIDILLTISS